MDVPHRDKLIYNRLDPESEGEPVESLLPPPERPLVPEIETPPPRAEKPSVTVEVPEAPVVPPTGTTSPPVASEPKPAPAPSVVAPPPMSSDTGAAGGARIQLSSVRSREAALDEWSRLSAANSDLLSDLRPHVEEATITGRGTFYRLQAGPFASRDAAAKRCDRLRTRKIACFAVVAP
jgi:cell division septation protein DedD